MNEQQIQKKIIDWLKANGYYVFKVISANRAGIPDIVGCTPWGQFFAIEVKAGRNKTSKLQDYNIAEILKRGGIAFVAYDLDTVKCHLLDAAQRGSKSLSKSQQTQQQQESPPRL